jgi:hypothetical protein
MADSTETLDRRPGERHNHHRAMLLWAMQSPERRSQNAVCRAQGATKQTIRKWRRADRWDLRAEAHGDEADQYALDLYRALYLADFGKLELPHVAPRIVRALGAVSLDDPTAQAQHDAVRLAAKQYPAGVQEAEQAAVQAAAKHRHDVRTDAERHIRLVDASLGLIAKRLKANEVRVTVRDIPVLLECRDRLVATVTGARQDAAGGGVVDSARVAHAKATGGDLVAAMHEDAVELIAILGALQAGKGRDRQGLADADAEVRALSAK